LDARLRGRGLEPLLRRERQGRRLHHREGPRRRVHDPVVAPALRAEDREGQGRGRQDGRGEVQVRRHREGAGGEQGRVEGPVLIRKRAGLPDLPRAVASGPRTWPRAPSLPTLQNTPTRASAVEATYALPIAFQRLFP